MADLNVCKGKKNINILKEDIKELSNSKIDKLEQSLKEIMSPDQYQVNKVSFKKPQPIFYTNPCYKRPTPIDLQLKDKDYLSRVIYDGRSIVEWSFDGLSEYQIVKSLSICLCLLPLVNYIT